MSGANVSPIGRNKEEWFVPPTDYRKLNEPPVLDVSPYRAHASRRAFQRNGAIYLMARPPLLCQAFATEGSSIRMLRDISGSLCFHQPDCFACRGQEV